MKDILLIAPYRQLDEWGNNSKALANLFVYNYPNEKLILRPVWYNNSQQVSTDTLFLEFEKHNVSDPSNTVLIQYGLPSDFIYDGDFALNVGVFHVDAAIGYMSWMDNLRLLDKIVVFSQIEKQLLINSGIDKDKIYAFSFPPLFMNHTKQDLDLHFAGTTFYTVGEISACSGLQDLILSYLSTFSITDNVTLVLASDNTNSIYDFIADAKKNLGIFSNPDYYPSVALVDNSAQHVVNYLHDTCDYYIDASYNSRPSQNMLRAFLFNRNVIMSDKVAESLELKNYPYTYGVEEDIQFNDQRYIHHMYDGRETWTRPKNKDLKHVLRTAFENKAEQHESLVAFKKELSKKQIDQLRGLIACFE